MPAEREFVQERFNIVKQILADKNRQRTRQEQIALEREHRLLGKILYEVEEGKVLSALTFWQKRFEHDLRIQQKRYGSTGFTRDEWQQLPSEERSHVPEPAKSPKKVIITDRKGQKFVIDDAYILLLNDLINRLQKWLNA